MAETEQINLKLSRELLEAAQSYAKNFGYRNVQELAAESMREKVFEKNELIKQNPYRYKRIHSQQYSKVFRIRFSVQRKETRLIYVVIEPNIILTCLLDRKHDYKDLEKYLSKIRAELGL